MPTPKRGPELREFGAPNPVYRGQPGVDPAKIGEEGLISLKDAVKWLNDGHTIQDLRREIGRGRLKQVRIRRAIRIPVLSLKAYAAELKKIVKEE